MLKHRWSLAPTVLAILVAVALAGCGDDAPPDSGSSTGVTASEAPVAPTATPVKEGAATSTAGATPDSTRFLRRVRTEDASDRRFDRPIEVGMLDGADLFVADQSGRIYRIRDGRTTEILDLSSRVLRSGNEEGLLSVAADPGFARNRHLWLYYSAASPRRSVLARFTMSASGTIDPASELIVLQQEQPYANHNGGAIRFGADGMLYLGLGDGGSAGDPQGNGQNLSTLLGKIIRIDVSQAGAAAPYRVPTDNPFVGRAGVRGEIWAYGLRNPWRMTFDTMTGALWVADVGQGAVEEVSLAARGDNLGWNRMEGDRCYQPSQGCDRGGLVLPLLTYTHASDRCSISGGPVVRGGRVPEVEGAYLYADYCTGELWGTPADAPGPGIPLVSGLGNVTGIAQAGPQIYVLAFGRPLLRIVGG